jgi:hypothetical protein
VSKNIKSLVNSFKLSTLLLSNSSENTSNGEETEEIIPMFHKLRKTLGFNYSTDFALPCRVGSEILVQPCSADIRRGSRHTCDSGIRVGLKWLMNRINERICELNQQIDTDTAEQKEKWAKEREEQRIRVEQYKKEELIKSTVHEKENPFISSSEIPEVSAPSPVLVVSEEKDDLEIEMAHLSSVLQNSAGFVTKKAGILPPLEMGGLIGIEDNFSRRSLPPSAE